jgi:sugar lactone lactonase YvrE
LPPLFGRIETLAGDSAQRYSGDGGDCHKAGLNRPYRCAVDNVGNLLIADSGNRRVRLIDLITRTITTYAGNGADAYAGDGGPALQASFGDPVGLALSKNGDLFVADRAHHVVRKVDAASGIVTTVAGTGSAGTGGDGGQAKEATLKSPADVAVDPAGRLLIADAGGNRIRAIDLAKGTIATVAGGGKADPGAEQVSALEAALHSPLSIACDAEGNVYVCEQAAHRVRKITADGGIEPFVGTGVPGNTGEGRAAGGATLREPSGVFVDASGNVLIADTGNHAIRFVERASGVIYTVAGGRRGLKGDGRDAAAAALDTPSGCAVDSDGYIYIADTSNHRIRSVVSVATEDDGFTDDDALLGQDSRLGGRRGRGGGAVEEE